MNNQSSYTQMLLRIAFWKAQAKQKEGPAPLVIHNTQCRTHGLYILNPLILFRLQFYVVLNLDAQLLFCLSYG